MEGLLDFMYCFLNGTKPCETHLKRKFPEQFEYAVREKLIVKCGKSSDGDTIYDLKKNL